MNENERDLDQHELEKIRMKKMRALIEAKKRKEALRKDKAMPNIGGSRSRPCQVARCGN